MATYSIGQLADAAGVNLETVRYYERRGLMAEPPRSPAGYRQYSGTDLWRLQFIGRAKGLGFTLAEIADILGDAEPGGAEPRAAERILEAATTKIRMIDAQQAELAGTRGRLERLVVACADGDDDCLALTVAPHRR